MLSGVAVMSKWRLIVLSVLIFCSGFSIGIVGKVIYENTTIKPYHWKTLPIVINCYGSDFSELQMIRAVEYWAIRGYNIGFYEHNPPESVCNNKSDWLYGMIIIRKASKFQLDHSTLASTRRYTSLNQMKGSIIYYKPGSFNLTLINEHELGHALGFTHVDIVGHIMHPHFNKMGRDFWIPTD